MVIGDEAAETSSWLFHLGNFLNLSANNLVTFTDNFILKVGATQHENQSGSCVYNLRLLHKGYFDQYLAFSAEVVVSLNKVVLRGFVCVEMGTDLF